MTSARTETLAANAPAASLTTTPLLESLQSANSSACDHPANPVVAENCQPGTTDWLIQHFQNDIEGYASVTSVNIGEKIDFFVNTSAAQFDLYIYRSGYYGGTGGRLMTSAENLKGGSQPACSQDAATGLSSCANWSVSYSLDIPQDWVSGIYIAKLVRPDTGGDNYINFVVRDDARDSAILYQQSSTTFAAYNFYGGKSVYVASSSYCPTVSDDVRAVKVSLNRPEANYGFEEISQYYNTYYRVEYAMVRWLEQQGYDVTYSNNMDTHNSGKPGAHNELLDHKIFLASGHDEYWSQEMRDAITAARDAGVNIGLFTANTGYWRIRFEPDPITNEPDSTMVVYKTTESGAADPVSPTTTWRDAQGIDNPENALNGTMYIGDNDHYFFPLRVSAAEAQDQLWRHTGLQNMPADTYIELGDQVVGWEWDAIVDNGHTPDGVKVIATTPVYGELLHDDGDFHNANVGAAVAQTTYYKASSGALVFASGTIQWAWGLGAQGVNVVEPDPYIEQLTYNILSDMGAQPASPTASLIMDGSDTPDPALPEAKIRDANAVVPAVISNIQTSIDGTTATFTWDTDVETNGQVWYNDQSGHVIYNTTPDLDYSTHHSLTLEGLNPSHTYYFRAVSTTRDWVPTISDEVSFQTGSLGLTGSVKYALKPLAQGGVCWVRANPATSIVLGIVVLVVMIGAGWWLISRRRRTPGQNAPSAS